MLAAGIVTAERWAKGLTYKEFLAQAKVNLDQFDQYYKTAAVSADDAAFFKKAASMPNGPTKMLVLVEDWCPDVFRGLPQLQKIAEASGIEMKVFLRDANLDIMAEFLNRGEFLSIPTVVFYTPDMKYLGHWIERAALAYSEQARTRDEVLAEMPTAPQPDRGRESARRLADRWGAWQQAQTKELRDLLVKALGTY